MVYFLFCKASPYLICSKFEEIHALWGTKYKILTCAKLLYSMCIVVTEVCWKQNELVSSLIMALYPPP